MKQGTYIILIVILSVYTIPVTGQSKKLIREQNIKTIKVYEERPQKNKEKLLESLTRYDRNGNIIEEIEYNNEGELKSHKKCKYDEFGNKIEEIEFDEDGQKISTTIYTYQQNLRTEKVEYNEKEKVKSRKTYMYEKY
jgi:hypothetical protein